MHVCLLFLVICCFQAANGFNVFDFGGIGDGFRQAEENSKVINPWSNVLRGVHGGLKAVRHVNDLHQVAEQLADKRHRRPDEKVIHTDNGKIITGHDDGPVTMSYSIVIESKED
uniref:Secreted protein n=1 Tax=Schistocephalus solidus TaxID=70667 RepID=A0A0X3PJH6_SCHSO